MALSTGGLQGINYRMAHIHSGINVLKLGEFGTGLCCRLLIPLRSRAAKGIWKPPWVRYVGSGISRMSVVSAPDEVWSITFVLCFSVWSENLASSVFIWCLGFVYPVSTLLAQCVSSGRDWVSLVGYSFECFLCWGVLPSVEVWFWNQSQLACNWLLHTHPQCLSSVSQQINITMPRRRGIPRHGSNSRSRGGSCSRGGSVPQCVDPLASVPPPSPPSDSSGPSLNSSFHSARFQFWSKLNKPLISAIVTALFSEEEEELASSDEPSTEPSHSRTPSDIKGSAAGDVLNDSGMMSEEGQQKKIHPQPSSSQEPIIRCEPACLSGNILSLVLPPGRSSMEAEDNIMVSWVNQISAKDSGSPPQD